MKLALLTIATGPEYHSYIRPFLESAKQFFPAHEPFLFTDSVERFDAWQFRIARRPRAKTIRHRYHTFLQQKFPLCTFDFIFHCDIDMLFVAPVSESDIFSDGITATLHPGFAVENTIGTPERRPDSTAFVPLTADNRYFAGAFVGGKADQYLKMAEMLRWMIDLDEAHGIEPDWFDEQYLQKYLYANPPAKILSPSFCYPEDYAGLHGWPPEDYPPVLVALDKGKRKGTS